jgi:DEAD/DEAH box helicase domain-containing protein
MSVAPGTLQPRHLALPAAALTATTAGVAALVFGATAWDVRTVEQILPSWAVDAVLTLLVVVLAFFAFAGLSKALSAIDEFGDAFDSLVIDSVLIANRRRFGVLLPPLLFAGAAVSLTAAVEGELNPWLAAIPFVMALAAVQALRNGSPPRTTKLPRGLELGESVPFPDAGAWWEQFERGPHNHGQVRWRAPVLEQREGGKAETGPGLPRLLSQLTGGGAFAHLVSAGNKVLEERACAIDFPLGSGLTALIGALAIQLQITSGETTLVVVPSASRARVVERKLRELFARDPLWKATIRVTGDASAPGGTPTVVCVDPRSLDRLLRNERWDDFLSEVGLVVLLGTQSLAGTLGQHATLLLRRLRLTLGRLGVRPRILAECISAQMQQGFLLDLLSGYISDGRLEAVADDSTARRVVELRGWIPNLQIQPETGTAHRRPFLAEVAMIAADAIKFGLRVMVVHAHPAVANQDIAALHQHIHDLCGNTADTNVDVVLAVDAARLSPREVDLVIYAGAVRSIQDLRYDVSLLGADRGPGPKYAIVVAVHEPVSMNFLLHQAPDSGSVPVAPPLTALQMENERVFELHLRAAIGSRSFTVDELDVLGFEHSREYIARWLSAGLLVSDAVRVGALTPANAAVADFNPDIDLEAAGSRRTAMVLNSATGQEVTALDESRVLRVAFPKALFVSDSTRYEVATDPAEESAGRMTVRMSASNILDRTRYAQTETTVKILEGGAGPIALRDGATAAEERSLRVAENVIGYVEGGLSEPMDLKAPALFDTPLHREFDTRGVVFTFPGTATEAAVHAAAHAMRAGIAAHLRYKADDLRFAVVESMRPATEPSPATAAHPSRKASGAAEAQRASLKLFIYDDVAGGAGLAGRVTDRLDEIFKSSLDLLLHCPCVHGCNSCVANPSCKRNRRPEDGLDKLGAIQILGALAGRDGAALRGERHHSVDKAADLAKIAHDIVENVFTPMLDITIERMPIITPDRMPEHVLGYYFSAEHRISLLEMPRDKAYEVLSHELAHAWSLKGGFGEALLVRDDPLYKLFVEGFAQWISYKTMDYFGFQKAVEDIAGRLPDEYGMGFRFFLELEEDPARGGVHGVLRFVREPDMAWVNRYLQSPQFQAELSVIKQSLEGVKGGGPDWSGDPEPEPGGTGNPTPPPQAGGADEAPPASPASDTTEPPPPPAGDVSGEPVADGADAPAEPSPPPG